MFAPRSGSADATVTDLNLQAVTVGKWKCGGSVHLLTSVSYREEKLTPENESACRRIALHTRVNAHVLIHMQAHTHAHQEQHLVEEAMKRVLHFPK